MGCHDSFIQSRRNWKPCRSASKFVQQIVAKLDASNMTYVVFCEKSGIRVQTFSDWKRGVTTPDVMSIEAMAQALGITSLEV